MPYLFAFDMDGTILPELRTIEPHLPAAVARAMAAGHRCMLATARPIGCVKWAWDALGLDTPVCLQNGVILAHPGDPTFPIDESPMPAPQFRAALDYAFTAFPHVHVYAEYSDRYWETRRAKGYFGMVAEACITESISADGPRPDSPCARISFYLPDPEQMNALADHFAADPTLSILRQPKHGRESRCCIYPAAADKWYAIERAAARMGFAHDEIVTFGDNWNDLTMLRSAAHGFALKGSGAAADCPLLPTTRLSCAEGGVADMIDAIVSGEIKL